MGSESTVLLPRDAGPAERERNRDENDAQEEGSKKTSAKNGGSRNLTTTLQPKPGSKGTASRCRVSANRIRKGRRSARVKEGVEDHASSTG